MKAARKSKEREVQRRPYRTHAKTMMRRVCDAVAAGKVEEARAMLPLAMKAIDTAAKKHIIHWRNAARKKSRLCTLCAQATAQ